MRTNQSFPFTSLSNLELHNVTAKRVTYRGKRAVRLVESDERTDDGDSIAILTDSTFRDGVIETEIAGTVLQDAAASMRGFVGIAFRTGTGGEQFECFYLRPTNGRADDQLRRNHATQYVSYPDYPWHQLRQETPGVYEAYADLVPGAWTKVKIVVAGVRAQLYVGGAAQPCLVVNDLKLGETQGQIALWIGTGTKAYFSKITVSTNRKRINE